MADQDRICDNDPCRGTLRMGWGARNGTTVCRDLIECDIDTPEGLAMARQRKLFATVCPKFVQDATEILEEILNPHGA